MCYQFGVNRRWFCVNSFSSPTPRRFRFPCWAPVRHSHSHPLYPVPHSPFSHAPFSSIPSTPHSVRVLFKPQLTTTSYHKCVPLITQLRTQHWGTAQYETISRIDGFFLWTDVFLDVLENDGAFILFFILGFRGCILQSEWHNPIGEWSKLTDKSFLVLVFFGNGYLVIPWKAISEWVALMACDFIKNFVGKGSRERICKGNSISPSKRNTYSKLFGIMSVVARYI